MLASMFIVAAMTSSCSTIQTVKIPIPVPCVTAIPSRPESMLDKLPQITPVYDAVQALLVDRERVMVHIGELTAILEACK